MKKIVKIFIGLVLALGCSFGVILDNSGMFVREAWATTASLDFGSGQVVPDNKNVTFSVLNGVYCSQTQMGRETRTIIFGVKADNKWNYWYINTSGDCSDVMNRNKSTLSMNNSDIEDKGYGNRSYKDTAGFNPPYKDYANAYSNIVGYSRSGGSGSGSSGSSGAPEMNVLKMCENKSDEEAVKCVIKLVVRILMYGVGVLGVVGIVLSGIQYITSQGDPAKMTKAKNRIINIVIGLIIYAVMYAGLHFLVPGFNDEGVFSGRGQPPTIQVADKPNVVRD